MAAGMAQIDTYRMLIDGQWVDAEDDRRFDSINPTRGSVWAIIPDASEADVNRAVEAAQRAFAEGPWSNTTATSRGKALRRLGDLLADKSDALGKTESIDTG